MTKIIGTLWFDEHGLKKENIPFAEAAQIILENQNRASWLCVRHPDSSAPQGVGLTVKVSGKTTEEIVQLLDELYNTYPECLERVTATLYYPGGTP